VIVRTADFDVPPAVAVIVADVLVDTLPVVTVKVAEVFPAGIVTDAGTDPSD
jgi:hypothetical protein